jgi:hypothetical protein
MVAREQSWAPTTEKSTTVDTDNPPTILPKPPPDAARNQQQPIIRQSTVSTPQPTPDNQQQTTTNYRYTTPSCFICTNLKPTTTERQLAFIGNLAIGNSLIIRYNRSKLRMDKDKPTRPLFSTDRTIDDKQCRKSFSNMLHCRRFCLALASATVYLCIQKKQPMQAKVFGYTAQDSKMACTYLERLVLCRRHPTKTELYTGTKA